MTNEEALKFLDEHCTGYVISLEVKALCSEALEKQIPKKPIYEDTHNIYGAYKRTCSACNDVVMISPQARAFEKYCRYCGNRLE